MARDGSGAYSLPGADFTNGTLADADEVMTKLDDLATAMTASIAKDGQTTPTAALPMGGYNHTNVGAATARTHYARAAQIADGALVYAGVGGGTADAITVSLSPAITAYVKGMVIDFVTGAGANTGAVTLNINGVGAGAVTWPDGTALAAGDLPASAAVQVVVAATTPVFHLQTLTRPGGGAMANSTFRARHTAGTGAPENITQAQALSILLSFLTPGHRLTLTTAVAVTVSDVTAAGTIYWTPDKHNLTPIYNGTLWTHAAVSEKSLALDSDSGHTGYHQSGKNFDVWLDYNAGTPRIGTGAAWTNDTTRADAISRDATYGYRVNNGTVTFRFGTASGDTASKTAGTLLYLGTFRASANGQTEDSLAKRFVWNMYNRVPRAMRVTEGTNSWTYSTLAFQQANASTANQLAFVRGLDEDAVHANVLAIASSSLATARQVVVAIGLDSTSALSGRAGVATTANDGNRVVTAEYEGFPGLGYHFLAWLEYGAGADTQTWLGDNGASVVQSGIGGTVIA
jgi:hypothetical protein